MGPLTVCTDPDGRGGDQWLGDSLEPPSGQLNLANPNIYKVLRQIYSDVIDVFPSGFFHIGGDEVIVGSDETWAACYNSSTLGKPILEYIARLGLSRGSNKTFYDLWANYTLSITDILREVYRDRKGAGLKKLHIWGGAGADADGVTYNLMNLPFLTSLLPPDLFVIQVWDSTDQSISKTLIDLGYEVVLSNTDYVYFDCGNEGWTNPGGYWCQPYSEWYHVYDYINDVKSKWGLSDAALRRVLGSETLAWAEEIDDNNIIQKLWPRSAALAEALWSLLH